MKCTSGDSELTVKEAFTYSPQKRLLTHTHQINGGAEQLLADNTYDELGKLTSKKVGNTSAMPLQNVNYTYNIRGWLTQINEIKALQKGTDPKDLFGFTINYNTVDGSTSAASPLYNGNIAETFWQTGADGNLVYRGYGYKYDSLNRLKDATYQKTGGILNNYDENLTYDKNGNILSLMRMGNSDTQSIKFLIDELKYEYTSPTSNQLAKVTEGVNGNSSQGFIDDNTTGNDYAYDANGNMTVDKNKKITAITYNHLNLPTKIIFTTGNIMYIYTASGQKMQKIVTDGTNTTTTDYLGGYQYQNTVLQFFPTAEGYVKNTPVSGTKSYSYVFNYTDHLGNVRISYTQNPSTNALTILDENNYYPFGLKHDGYNPIAPTPEYKYKYNGKELQDELGLNMYSYGFRDYMPDIGRFTTQDALAEKYYDWTPYNYVGNNPILRMDFLGLDWFTDKDGSYQYDPKINNKSKLQEGQKYVGKTYEVKNSDGKIITTYRKDGSIQYANRMDALKRVYDNAQKTGKEELAILTKGGGALVTPDYKNTTNSCSPFEFYNYSYDKKGNIFDAEGDSFAAVGSIHPHPDKNGEQQPSGTNWGAGDLETFSLATPNKPIMTMGWDGKVYGVFGSYKNNSGYTRDLNWGWLKKNGDYTVQEILKSSGKLQLLMNSTFGIK